MTSSNYTVDKCVKALHTESSGITTEEIFLDSVDKDYFFTKAAENRINIKSIFAKTPTIKDKHRLNLFLRKIKEENHVNIMDSLLAIEENYAKFYQLIKMLDQENLYMLKEELGHKYPKYRMITTKIKDFLEF